MVPQKPYSEEIKMNVKLTQQEIESWDKIIERSGDLDLIRRFYPRIGNPNQVKDNFSKAVRDLSRHDNLLQDKFEQGVYRPELSDDEVKAIATEAVRHDVKEGYLGGIFRKLQHPVYQGTTFNDEELEGLVNRVLQEGAQDYHPGEDPKAFSEGLIEFPYDHECPEEVGFTFWVVSNDNYRRLARPELSRNIVTLKIFHELLKWNFEGATQIKQKHSDFYDEKLLQDMIIGLEGHEKFTRPEDKETYGIEYLVLAQRSEFGSLFTKDVEQRIKDGEEGIDKYVREYPNEVKKGAELENAKQRCLAPLRRVSLAKRIHEYLNGAVDESTEEMDKAISKLKKGIVKRDYSNKRGIPYKDREAKPEDALIGAFKECDDDLFGSVHGVVRLHRLLQDGQYLVQLGDENFQRIVRENVEGLLKKGKAKAVYSMIYGTNIGYGRKLPGVQEVAQCVSINRTNLLEKMVESIEWKPEDVLSEKYDFSCDNLTFIGTGDVDDAYDLYQDLRRSGEQMPSQETLRKLMFFRVAMHAKEFHEGRGMKTIVEAYENPQNQEVIDPPQMKVLLTKVFDENYHEGFRQVNKRDWRGGGKNITSSDSVSYFYALANSRLGELFRDYKPLEPYFKLVDFLD